MSVCNLIIICYMTVVIGEFIQDLPTDDYELNQNDFRKKFMATQRQKIIKNKRTDLLDKYLYNNIAYLHGIIHYEINENNTKWNIIRKVEKEFRLILAMEGVKYTYQRGSKWRTWREISQNDEKKIVCYVCQNVAIGNCTNCNGGGHWTIEDKPPCPYEIFSIKSDSQICAKYYTQYKNTSNDCPSVINFEDLGVTCHNPIETKWRIIRDYKKLKSFPARICNGKEYCDITTLYTIDSQGISFRMINASNDVFYSRVMKKGGKNYACVDDCGYWDPNTKKIATQRNPLSFDLLGNKKKREDLFRPSTTQKSTNIKISFHPYKLKYKYALKVNKDVKSTEKSAGISELNVDSTTMSHCKKLEKTENKELQDEDSDYRY